MTRHQAYRDLASAVCACGKPKMQFVAFCPSCFSRLPTCTQDKLSGMHNITDEIAASLELLGLKSLAVTRDEALDNFHRNNKRQRTIERTVK